MRDIAITTKSTELQNFYALTGEEISALCDYIKSPSVGQAIFGDFTKWASSCYWLPINLENTLNFSGPLNLSLGDIDTNIKIYVPLTWHEGSYSLGEYQYLPKYNDFRDYEPYTKLSIYLPYYGEIELPILEVMNKYIQFRLNIDFLTGQAAYIIGVNDNQVNSQILVLKNSAAVMEIDKSTRIIATIVFQMGVKIPFTQTNASENLRNLILGGLDLGLKIGGIAASLSEPNPTSTTTAFEKNIKTVRNPTTGRQITARTTTKERTTNTTYSKPSQINNISSAIESGLYCLANFVHSEVRSNASSNSIINSSGGSNIIIYRKTCKMLTVSESYKKIFGVPLGQVKSMSACRGYTEVTGIHLEGTGFNSCTEEEKDMIQEYLANGVIFPDPT